MENKWTREYRTEFVRQRYCTIAVSLKSRRFLRIICKNTGAKQMEVVDKLIEGLFEDLGL